MKVEFRLNLIDEPWVVVGLIDIGKLVGFSWLLLVVNWVLQELHCWMTEFTRSKNSITVVVDAAQWAAFRYLSACSILKKQRTWGWSYHRAMMPNGFISMMSPWALCSRSLLASQVLKKPMLIYGYCIDGMPDRNCYGVIWRHNPIMVIQLLLRFVKD